MAPWIDRSELSPDASRIDSRHSQAPNPGDDPVRALRLVALAALWPRRQRAGCSLAALWTRRQRAGCSLYTAPPLLWIGSLLQRIARLLCAIRSRAGCAARSALGRAPALRHRIALPTVLTEGLSLPSRRAQMRFFEDDQASLTDSQRQFYRKVAEMAQRHNAIGERPYLVKFVGEYALFRNDGGTKWKKAPFETALTSDTTRDWGLSRFLGSSTSYKWVDVPSDGYVKLTVSFTPTTPAPMLLVCHN